MAADAVSSARPAPAARASRAVRPASQRPSGHRDGQRGVTEAYAIQAGREVRVMVDADRVSDDEAYLIAHEIAKVAERR
jgi:ribonuclease Y